MASTETPHFVPYPAYKSKRHSRNLSNSHLTSSPPRSLIVTDVSTTSNPTSPVSSEFGEHNTLRNGDGRISVSKRYSSSAITIQPPPINLNGNASVGLPIAGTTSLAEPVAMEDSLNTPPQPRNVGSVVASPIPTSRTSASSPTSSSSAPALAFLPGLSSTVPAELTSQTEPTAGPSKWQSTNLPARRVSTFRHVPLRNTSTPLSPSPLRPNGKHPRTVSLTSRQFDQAHVPAERARSVLSSPVTRVTPTDASTSTSSLPNHISSPPLPPKDTHHHEERDYLDFNHPPSRTASLPPKPPPKSPSPALTPAGSTPVSSPSPSISPLPRSSTPIRSSAPYRHGFQPGGVRRQLTDDFLEARRALRDAGRIERTRLERRLEKLIALHFNAKGPTSTNSRAQPSRRASSFFDIDIKELRNLDAADLWRNMMQNQITPGSKADIRAQEQSITPWENDSDVSQCPLCSASFHPITNRKHHCRLCGRIVCSLPAKRGQRPVTCSLLFIADKKTGKIEEVGEGVDYGVRRRSSMGPQNKGKEKEALIEEEKFLQGVRICRECSSILKRQQHRQEAFHVPTYAKLYEAFTNLEKQIEDALPVFQELLLALNNDDQPTAEASAARKRLLEAFAQYDSLAKRIRTLPTPGPGSSQDRVQAAILTRASVFLQKHMFPLRTLPKPKKATSSPITEAETPVIDPDSNLAHVLQPLLEQEALLESFVEEAKAHRKFEDVQTLKANLREIRSEIDKVLANADYEVHRQNGQTN